MMRASTLMRERTCSRRSGGSEADTPRLSAGARSGGSRVTCSCMPSNLPLSRLPAQICLRSLRRSSEDSVRVLIVMAAQWPRALIRAALQETGYDALGARDLDEALTYPVDEAGRGA